MSTQEKNTRAIRFYSFLLSWYPSHFSKKFRSEMLQTFKDHYVDVVENEGGAGIGFWFDTISDDMLGIVREQLSASKRKSIYPIVIFVTACLFPGSFLIMPVISLFLLYISQVSLLLLAYFLLKKASTL
jgi:hypothetical protein